LRIHYTEKNIKGNKNDGSYKKGDISMKIIAINGSPRKNWNTHILLNKALEGARSVGAETELIHLYDLDYKGCIGCLACKIKNGKSLGHCAVSDDLKSVLDEIDKCDGLILGSPIYLGDVTAMMRAFIERFTFQYLSYNDFSETFYKGNIKKSAFIYTMNAPDQYIQGGYGNMFESYKKLFSRFGYDETLYSTETLQVKNYSKYHMAAFNEANRKKRREEVFPIDCQKAFDIGKRIVVA
jgi:multimeric flavodoxin WrbA